jgi:thiosulfate/3-mercaptopyruvate sulfurtransferase
MTDYKQPEVLVSTEWVARNGTLPGARLIEVDVDTSAYDQGHIPGAVGLNWTSQLCDRVRRDVLTKPQFEELCRRMGIANDTTLVFYGDNHNWFAAYAFWQFRYYGHAEDKLKLMNGGRSKWIAEGRALERSTPPVERSHYVAASPDRSLRAFRDDVAPALGRKDINLIDVRSEAEYRGEIIAPPGMNESAQRGGHIPGAQHVPWAQTVREDGTFKSYDELKTLYESRGVDLQNDTITYCRIGERSSHSWFALKYLLGVDLVANYDGSWTEWGNLIGAPIARGPERG